jgi:hypothetical protein
VVHGRSVKALSIRTTGVTIAQVHRDELCGNNQAPVMFGRRWICKLGRLYARTGRVPIQVRRNFRFARGPDFMGVAGASFRSARDRSIFGCGIHLVVAVFPKKLSSGGEVLLKGRRFADH